MRALIELLSQWALRLVPLFTPKGPNPRTRVALLVFSNILPILGVLFFHWNPIFLMIVYWMESLAIGFFNVPRMILSGAVEKSGRFSIGGLIAGIFLSAFFTFHYGMFMACHLAFLLIAGMIGHSFGTDLQDPLLIAVGMWGQQVQTLKGFWGDPVGFLSTPLFAGIVIFISTGIHVWQDFIKTKAYRPLGADACMFEPYPRVFVMHLTLILGAVPMMLLKIPAGAMAVFVLFKVVAEVKAMDKVQANRDVKIEASREARSG